ncbi:MAG: exonuclease SbcCD subunit D C-terminal domain-containing protein [Sphaerochaetaceae bacterium]|nr:exonuclease SbcCD subunit D C-terminal domain-containing protein [Sphaerochaetaceae bacterium]
MKILHTSDWHIGRTLGDKRRYEEHLAFLEWLLGILADHEADMLLICGDVFDTIAPSNKSLQLYYEFLRKAHDRGCRHIVIVGGNHDAPSLLDAPRLVLQSMGVHVVGGAVRPEEEVLLLRDETGKAEAIVCAVPFLRDRDVRQVVERESIDDKGTHLVTGIAEHYRQVGEEALCLRSSVDPSIPIIYTGHLFTSGGKTTDGDGVRDLYVGTAVHVDASIFPDHADYVALGHLHVPQQVGDSQVIRYSGSPIPMGFSECTQQKEVVLVEFSPHSLFPLVSPITVPRFQHLEHIEGDLEEILAMLHDLVARKESVWVEIDYRGSLPPSSLREAIQEVTAASEVEILRLRNTSLGVYSLESSGWEQTLEDLDEREVFRRRLDQTELNDEEKQQLVVLHEQVLRSLVEEEIS